MVDLQKVEAGFKKLVESINKNPKAKDILKSWLKGYYGRVHNFQIGSKEFHIVFKPDGAEFGSGLYPAPDLTLKVDPDAWNDMISGKAKPIGTGSLLDQGKLMIYGAGNEIAYFTKLAMTVGVIPLG
jgi:putative sterol carrier protein